MTIESSVPDIAARTIGNTRMSLAGLQLQVAARLRHRVKQIAVATALMVSSASVGYAQAPTNERPDTPVFRVQVWGFIAADFSTRISSYVELRSRLEKGLPALTVTDDPEEIWRAQRALAIKIRIARAAARQGEIFTSAISVEFRNVLLLEMNPDSMAAIMDENPGEGSHRINRAYPTGKPRASMPSDILAVLPQLPDDVEYRFLGRTLILIDTRANLILDRMPCAIACAADE
jgi:hypothetical protein